MNVASFTLFVFQQSSPSESVQRTVKNTMFFFLMSFLFFVLQFQSLEARLLMIRRQELQHLSMCTAELFTHYDSSGTSLGVHPIKYTQLGGTQELIDSAVISVSEQSLRSVFPAHRYQIDRNIPARTLSPLNVSWKWLKLLLSSSFHISY